MSNGNPGTIELVLREISKVFVPLQETIESGESLTLLAELGIQFPESLASDPAFENALTNIADAAAALPPLLRDLNQAIASEDYATLALKIADIVQRLTDLIDNFQDLADAIEAKKNSLPGFTPAEVEAFAADLPERLADYLLIRHTEDGLPQLAAVLDFIGIFERTEKNAGSVDLLKPPYVERRLRTGNVTAFLDSPSGLLETLYGWGAPSFDGRDMLQKIEGLALELGLPAVYIDAPSPSLDFMFVEIRPKTDVDPRGLVLLLTSILKASKTFTLEQDQWKLEFGSEIETPVDASLTVQPNGNVAVKFPAGDVSGEVFARWTTKPSTPGGVFLLIGEADKSRLEFQELSAEARAKLAFNAASSAGEGEVIVGAELKGGKLVIDLSGADSFVRDTAGGGGFTAEFELAMGVSSSSGFYFRGSSALEIRIPIHLDLAVAELTSLTLGAGIQDGEFPIKLGADIKAKLGPLTAVVERIGLSADFRFPGSRGNLGPVDLDFSFLWPTGIGLSLDAGGFKGGGFLSFDPDNGRYVGILELEFQETIEIKAIGLLTTKMPDGSEGFSLLIIITAEFTPIQLGFGFTLNGVGGLFGLNRTTEVDRLRTGVKDDTLKSILFPENVVANASRIISDIRQVFPPRADRFVFGPMGKLGWGTPSLITAEIGLIIEVPDPFRIMLLGVIRALLPNEDMKLLRIQVNFLGVLDFEKKLLSFDASLYDSKLISFTLSGDMALRVAWGDDPNFLLSVGGFHPAYNPPPLALPQMARLSIQLLGGSNPRLAAEVYFAVTSNTVQFGAKVELYAAAGPFNAYGFLGFDVLFQFNPFYFNAQIAAMIALRAGSGTIAGISLSFNLEGPSPWKAKGTAKLKLFWFLTVKVRFSVTWGEERDTLLDDVAVLPLLTEALQDAGNWSADVPERRHLLVTLREIESASGAVVAHPFGVLHVSQKVVPLNLVIDKFGSRKPSDANEFQIRSVTAGEGAGARTLPSEAVKEHFAPAQFLDLKDQEKLSRKSFEKLDGGVKITESEKLDSDHYTMREVEYELSYIDSQRNVIRWPFLVALDAAAFNAWSTQGSIAQSTLSHARNKKPALAPEAAKLSQEAYAIVSTADLKLYDADSMMSSEAEAVSRLNRMRREDPSLEGELQVVPAFEVNPHE